MLIDGLNILPSGLVTNIHIESGTTLPTEQRTARLYYLTQVQGNLQPGLYFFDGTKWKPCLTSVTAGPGIVLGGTDTDSQISVDSSVIPTQNALTTHIDDASVHLTSAQNTLLDGLDPALTSTELNYVHGVTSGIQSQIDAEVSRAESAESTLTTNLNNEVTRAQNAEQSNTTAINNEVSRAQGAESTLTTNLNNEITRAQNAEATKVDKSGDTMTGALTLSADPTQGLHAATKQYVDAVKTGLDVKDSVKVATTGSNITLSGLFAIDGYTLLEGDRVLVKDQTDKTTNGIYNATASGAWSRSSDADNTPSNEVNSGMFCFIEQGTTNASTGWILTTTGTITLGTTSLTFAQFTGAGEINPGNGLSKSGNVMNVTTANTNNIVSTAGGIDLATSGITAGTYSKVTFDSYGRATNGSNPTTLSGYGITDAASLNGNSVQTFSVANATGTQMAIPMGQADGRYLGISAQAADSAKLGGTAASSYATQSWTSTNYLSISAQAVDSAKLNGQTGSYYQNASNINSGTLGVSFLTGTYNINISGNAATASSASQMPISDTRNTNTTPGTYSEATGWNFKSISTIGLSASGTYAAVQTIVPWTDDSGGNSYDIAYAGGSIYYRTGTHTNGWGAWNTIWTAANFTPSSKLDTTAQAADSAKLNGQAASYYQNASNINAGTLGTSYLSGTYSISISGNAATATNSTQWSGSNKTISTGTPSGGVNGDIWFQY